MLSQSKNGVIYYKYIFLLTFYHYLFAGKLAGIFFLTVDSLNVIGKSHQMPLPGIVQSLALLQAGARFGSKGTHTTRTSMQQELADALAVLPVAARREDFRRAIVEENVLGKSSMSNRILSNQRLGELYGLDPSILLYRVLRHLWELDPQGRHQVAHLCALARDPLLRATAEYVIPIRIGGECIRHEFTSTLREAVDVRMNDSTLDKVARNSGASWSVSGHLKGRVRKIRQSVTPTVGGVAYALWIGSLEGRVGDELYTSFWMSIFDAPISELHAVTLRAKQMNLIRAAIGGEVVQVDPSRLLEATLQS